MSSIKALVSSLRALVAKLDRHSAFLPPALLRITVGTVFLVTGWGKLGNLDQVTEFFASLDIPWPALNARVVAATEFFGGILVLAGLGTRLAALPLAFTMVVAIITAKRAELDGVASLLGFEEWSYLVMFVILALRGPGPLSLDGLLARLFARDRASALPRPLLPSRQGTLSSPGA